MLCTVELMLAGLCTNIPMPRPFYIRLRSKYWSSNSKSNSKGDDYTIGSCKAVIGNQSGQGVHTTWIELVSYPYHFLCLALPKSRVAGG